MKKRQFLRVASGLTMGVAVFATGMVPMTAAFAGGVYKNSDNVAIHGYDPVGYFKMGKPVEGIREFSSKHDGAVWLFSSAENKTLFDGNPSKYAPQYGGHCAYAVSKGAKAPTVPEAWTIADGKLYLNYSIGVRQTWQTDQAENIKKADINWPGLR